MKTKQIKNLCLGMLLGIGWMAGSAWGVDDFATSEEGRLNHSTAQTVQAQPPKPQKYPAGYKENWWEPREKYGFSEPERGVPIQIPKRNPQMEWFETAKLGIFLHWGIWSVYPTNISNAMNRIVTPQTLGMDGTVSPEVYYTQLPLFRAENYDPSKWAGILHKAGAKYVALVTKHHDGVALWDTQAPGGVSVVKQGGAKRDLVAPFVDAMRKEGLRVGFYFSDADWGNPDYASMPPPANMVKPGKNLLKSSPLSYSEKEEPERWARFIKYRDFQIGELLKYKPDIWWIDGEWERTPEQWKTDDFLTRVIENDPHVIIGRIAPTTTNMPGLITYSTPEQVVAHTKTPKGPWELCITFNDHWGYVPGNADKSASSVVQLFSEVIARGGNLLLNIGPKSDGTLPENTVKELLKVGEWIGRNAEAIYPTFGGEQAGISFHRFFGPTTVAPDGRALYLFVNGQPGNDILLRGIVSKIRKAEVLSTGEELDFHRQVGYNALPGYYVINAPKSQEPLMTVVKLSFDEVIELDQ